jgi:hypothetical protein
MELQYEMKESIYLETSVVSYYTSKPSRDIIVLAHQEITREWWPTAIKRGEIIKKLIEINNLLGIHTPVICTPEELMGN